MTLNVKRSGAAAVIPVLLAMAPIGAAQEHAPGGASGKLGTVHFVNSCSQAAQPTFDRPVALLHSFEFGRASDAFNQPLEADPACAIADWGIAMSRWSNPFAVGVRPPAQLQKGLDAVDRGNAIGAKTSRERAYIDAVEKLYRDFDRIAQRERVLAYRDAMAALADKFPEDPEASIFYALSLS